MLLIRVTKKKKRKHWVCSTKLKHSVRKRKTKKMMRLGPKKNL